MTKKRHIVDLCINLLDVILIIYCVSTFFTVGGSGNMQVWGVKEFVYFTNDSNILAAVGCLIGAIYNIKALRSDPSQSLPHGVFLFKWVGTVAVTITFVVVICFLGPLSSYSFVYENELIWLHGVCPILCILSTLFIEKGTITLRESLWGLVPVIIYGIVYFVMVIAIGKANGGWVDFYQFNMNGMWPITLVVMTIVSTAIALLERLPHRQK